MPDWLLIAIVSALTGSLITVVAQPLLQRLGKTLRQIGQWLNHWRKYLTGAEQHRADAMVSKPPPLWLLKRTLFRWFQNNPQTYWPQLRQISDSDHSKTGTIEELLWVDKPMEDLQKGDVLYYGGHLLNKIFFRPEKQWWLHTADGTTETYPRDATMKTATGGWCSRRNSGCHYCPKNPR